MIVRGKPSHSILAVLAVLLLALTGSIARASVTPLTLEQLVAVSDEVHTVKIESQESYFFEGKIFTTAKVDIFESFKGDMTGKAEISYLGGTVDWITTRADTGMEDTKPGDFAVLFLNYPLKQVTDAERSMYRADSPGVKSPQLTGGFQGRFPMQVFESTVPEGSPAARATLMQSAVVKRPMPGAPRTAAGGLQGIMYPEFSATVRALVAEESGLRARGASSAGKIAGIRGQYFVPQRRADNKVARACDPLPALAYVSDQELTQIRARAQQQVDAAKARRARAKTKDAVGTATTQDTQKEGGK